MADASYDKNWAPELLAAGITPDADPLDLKALLRQIIAKVGTAGNTTVRKFAFAFNSPGILTGRTLYTPTIGDILVDAWIEVDTAWDGTTPTGDFGTFVGGTSGLLEANSTFISGNLSVANSMADRQVVGNAGVLGQGPGTFVTSLFIWGPANSMRPMKKFTAANPIKICVSQDGTTTGADPGSTQGAAVLFLVTATPA